MSEPNDDDQTYITQEQARELAVVAGAIGEFAAQMVELSDREKELQAAIETFRLELPALMPRTEALVNRRRLAVGMAIAGLLATFLAVNLSDHHIERCGPAHRPNSAAAKRFCDVTFFLHDHETEAEYHRRLADELLRNLGHNPDVIRSTTTTTTVPPATPPSATQPPRTPTTVRRTTTTARRVTTTTRRVTTTRAPAPPPTPPPCEKLPNGKCKNEPK